MNATKMPYFESLEGEIKNVLNNFFTIRQPPSTLNKLIMIEIGFRLGLYMYKRALLGKKSNHITIQGAFLY